MVAHDCHLSYKGSINRRIMVQTDLDINVTPHFKKCLKWEAGGMAQVIDHLSGMHKALSANPSMTIKMWMIVASQANIILMMHQEPWGYVYNEHNTDEETEAQRALTFCYNSVVEPQSKPGSLASQSILFFFFFGGMRILSSGPCTCKAGILLLEPYFQSILLWLFGDGVSQVDLKPVIILISAS
jgi:hypothetical protein